MSKKSILKIMNSYRKMSTDRLLMAAFGPKPNWEEEFLAKLLYRRIPDQIEFERRVDECYSRKYKKGLAKC